MEPDQTPQSNQTISRITRSFLMCISVIFLAFVLVLSWMFLVPTSDFPVGQTILVPPGATLSGTADILKEKNVISSSFLLKGYMKIFGRNKPVLAGNYLLDQKQSLLEMADRITSGDFRVPRISILVTEGMDIFDIARVFEAQMPSFDSKEFLALASKEEGYLFPDTYFFFSAAAPEDVISVMKNNFSAKIAPLKEKIDSSERSLADIVIMASIIEREAVTPKDRRIIAGILWKRISLGMPLQVDAAFDYVNGKGSASLTMSDLKIDSPYNTYTHKGLPPGPICNPGLDVILAAMEPTQTQYLYYLSDKSGVIHYSKNFEEHKANKIKYL